MFSMTGNNFLGFHQTSASQVTGVSTNVALYLSIAITYAGTTNETYMTLSQLDNRWNN
jgi:hypothetical protein